MVNITLAHDVDNVNRTQDVHISEDVTFDAMLLKSKTLKGLKKSGFCYPSPIQLLGIPLGKCGFDLLLEAKSGTGKTAVFTIVALEKLNVQNGLQTVILTPTREIASQICDVTKQIGAGYKDLNVEVVIGGLSVEEDVKKFNKKVHVLVASPGRLKHLMQMKVIDISAVRLLVIDEADKLMENSFIADLNYIFKELPAEKQVIMSSATYPEESKKYIQKYLKNFQHICPENSCVLKGVVQKVTIVASNSNIVRQTQYRFKELVKILSKKQFKQCLIFCNYQVRVMELQRMLAKEQWPVESLYSKQEQSDRLDALKTLQDYKCRILVSTDLAARGIDASNVDLVVNFEPPFEWQTYLHRIGRAGRFGSYGIAITILSDGNEIFKFRNLLKGMKNSLDLQHLWTGETFELDCDDNQTQCLVEKLPDTLCKETSNNDIYAEFWDVLTSGNVQNDLDIKINIESFTNLLNSYDNDKKQSVLSFSDLIKSFHTVQDEDKADITFQTLNADLPIDKLLSVIDSKTKGLLDVTNRNYHEEMSFLSNTNRNRNKINSNSNVQLNIENNDSLVASNQDQKQFEDCDKAKLNLGLPVCFSSKKILETKPRRSIKSEIVNTLCNKTSTQSRRVATISGNKPRNYSRLKRNQNIASDDSEDEKELIANVKPRFVKISQSFKSKQDDKMEQQFQYMLWYSQLKSHINSLEMAFYLNELSKP